MTDEERLSAYEATHGYIIEAAETILEADPPISDLLSCIAILLANGEFDALISLLVLAVPVVDRVMKEDIARQILVGEEVK